MVKKWLETKFTMRFWCFFLFIEIVNFELNMKMKNEYHSSSYDAHCWGLHLSIYDSYYIYSYDRFSRLLFFSLFDIMLCISPNGFYIYLIVLTVPSVEFSGTLYSHHKCKVKFNLYSRDWFFLLVTSRRVMRAKCKAFRFINPNFLYFESILYQIFYDQ